MSVTAFPPIEYMTVSVVADHCRVSFEGTILNFHYLALFDTSSMQSCTFPLILFAVHAGFRTLIATFFSFASHFMRTPFLFYLSPHWWVSDPPRGATQSSSRYRDEHVRALWFADRQAQENLARLTLNWGPDPGHRRLALAYLRLRRLLEVADRKEHTTLSFIASFAEVRSR